MDSIKKNMKRIWKSKCKYLVIIACALMLANGVNLLQTSLKFLNKKGEMVEVKSVVITSKTWESKGPGSWKVEKSADWTGYKKATIKFDVETNGLTGHSERDIILVLDNSVSMGSQVNRRQKLVQLQSDATELINFLMTEEGTRIAVINFNSTANLLTGFTSDSSKLTSVINSLRTRGGTSYKNAYQAVINLLSGYEEAKDRDLVMLFLTDGGAPAASAEYSVLKGRYNIQIVGIQYELGTSIKQSIIDSSDVQYAANTTNLKDVFFESIGVDAYEEFEITDYITEEFEVENVSDIRLSRGEVKLETDEDGKQKVIWTLASSDVKFITSFGATMEIDIVYKGELNPDRVIETNEKETVKVKLPEPGPTPGPDEIESVDVPEIRGGYYVTYDPNLPRECNPSGKDVTVTKAHFPYEKVDRGLGNYSCPGWQIKEWKIDGTEPDLGGDKFEMPSRDTEITAIWTKIGLNKKMEGTVYEVKKQDLLEAMIENAGTVSVDSSISFGSPSSSSNGRGLYIRSGTQNDAKPIYYYRGAVMNNNVLFAGICWQIVRTTESGGIKLIYNGVSSDGKTCISTDNSYITEISFNLYHDNVTADGNPSFAYSGYMYDKGTRSYSESSKKYVYGNDVIYDSSKRVYKLVSTTSSTKTPGSGYHYTCMKTSASGTCTVAYYAYMVDNGSMRYFYLHDGDTIETLKEKMFSNKYDSSVKGAIDNWYKTNIEDKGYTKYLDQNTVWCNDRSLASGGIVSKNATFGKVYYGASGTRHLNSTSANPGVKESVACPRIVDRFTTSSASEGNKVLTYPVGMLTVDEVVLSGIGYSSNNTSQDSYLYTGYNYWTMTPSERNDSGYSREYSHNAYISSSGYFDSITSSDVNKVRPMISLKSNTLVYDDGISGTKEHPYVVVME